MRENDESFYISGDCKKSDFTAAASGDYDGDTITCVEVDETKPKKKKLIDRLFEFLFRIIYK